MVSEDLRAKGDPGGRVFAQQPHLKINKAWVYCTRQIGASQIIERRHWQIENGQRLCTDIFWTTPGAKVRHLPFLAKNKSLHFLEDTWDNCKYACVYIYGII